MKKKLVLALIVLVCVALPGCRRKKYENPIANDSSQPDKTLFDRAVNDIEKSRYEVARITLQTMINTYPDSEYLAKAKLAVADTWYRQGGSSGLAQAEAEYKDFITFFPNMEEAVEAQYKVAMIHYNQMEKADRDSTHARRAEDEFKSLLTMFPDSKFSEEATQRLREVQEVLAEGEFRVGRQYFVKGSNRSTVIRLSGLTTSYPYYSQADTALFMLGETYERSGKAFQTIAADTYAKLIKEYPLSDHVGDAKAKLTAWKKPIPEPDPEALKRMKYDQEHRDSTSRFDSALGLLKRKPDVTATSHSGDPLKVHLPPPPPGPEPTTGAGVATGEIKAEKVDGAVPEGAKVMTPGGKPDDTAKPDEKKPEDETKPDDPKDKKKKKKKP